jgi:AraC-like DNA-binding protein
MKKIDLSSVVIKEILSIFPIKLSAYEEKGMTNRNGTGFIFAEKGQLTYSMNGHTFVSDQNHALLLPSGATYSILSVTDSVSLLINTIATGYDFNGASICVYKINSPMSFFSVFHRLDTTWTFRKNAYKLKCMAGLYDLLVKIHEMDTLPYTPDYKYDQIEKSIEYLEEHYNNPLLTNDLLADQSNISTVYFRKLFTEKYGMPPMKYVKKKRIEKAQEMLKGNMTTVIRISESVGFASINNFSRSFKNITGYSPQEYKKKSAHGHGIE